MTTGDGDSHLKAFATAAVVFIAVGNGLDWAGLGPGGWFALVPSLVAYRWLRARRDA